jgi:hypothetical protein
MKRFLFLLSVAVLAITTSGNARVRSEEFTKEVQDVARQFAQRLQETREFKPEGDKLFVDRFVDCHLRAESERRENGIFSQISASIPDEISREARDEELRRYLIARLNFFHLTTLHRMSTRDLEGRWDNSFFSAEHEYPPGVYELLMKNPAIAAAAVGENKDRVTISGSIKNVRQLRSVVPTVEQAMSAMRQYFMAHPPEETELYKKNMERVGNDKNNSKFWEVSFHKISVKDAKENSRCLGFAARMFAIVKVPPFYQLFVFQDGGRFKIGSMLCTEPPCVD